MSWPMRGRWESEATCNREGDSIYLELSHTEWQEDGSSSVIDWKEVAS